jgi:hypothetical protein
MTDPAANAKTRTPLGGGPAVAPFRKNLKQTEPYVTYCSAHCSQANKSALPPMAPTIRDSAPSAVHR